MAPGPEPRAPRCPRRPGSRRNAAPRLCRPGRLPGSGSKAAGSQGKMWIQPTKSGESEVKGKRSGKVLKGKKCGLNQEWWFHPQDIWWF